MDTTKLFGLDLGSALRNLCQEEPSVAIASASTSALSSSTAIYPEQDTDLGPDLGSNSGTTRRMSDVESHRLDVIERRRIAESLSDASPSCPRTAMALGLSSLSLRCVLMSTSIDTYTLPPSNLDSKHKPIVLSLS